MKAEELVLADYILGVSTYGMFRRDHMRNVDAPGERLWSRVEGACADFDFAGEIPSEEALRRELLDILVCYGYGRSESGVAGTENAVALTEVSYTTNARIILVEEPPTPRQQEKP